MLQHVLKAHTFYHEFVWNAVNILRLVYIVTMYLWPLPNLPVHRTGQLWSWYSPLTKHNLLQHTQKEKNNFLLVTIYIYTAYSTSFFGMVKKKKKKYTWWWDTWTTLVSFCCPSILACCRKVDYCFLVWLLLIAAFVAGQLWPVFIVVWCAKGDIHYQISVSWCIWAIGNRLGNINGV